MKKLLLITLFLGWAALSFAAKVDTLLIKSPSMNKDVKVVVVTPDVALGKKALACPFFICYTATEEMPKHGLE
ncbi:hypothetical protein KUBF_15670 [Bacteroides finegoldii]|nr:hypothetical protein KUBF_15670 [Bacteroides finegoldii]